MPKMQRRRANQTQDERRLLEEFARIQGLTPSIVARSWMESYLENGVPIEKPSTEESHKLQIFAPRELIDAVDERLEREGLTLTDVIRWEVQQIETL